MVLGAIFTVCIMMSVVTAVPQTQSDPVMDVIERIEELEQTMDETRADIAALDPEPGGIIDLLKQLINLIIQAVLNLIDIIRSLIGLVALIEYLIELVMVFIDAIMALIEMILNLFNPSLTV